MSPWMKTDCGSPYQLLNLRRDGQATKRVPVARDPRLLCRSTIFAPLGGRARVQSRYVQSRSKMSALAREQRIYPPP